MLSFAWLLQIANTIKWLMNVTILNVLTRFDIDFFLQKKKQKQNKTENNVDNIKDELGWASNGPLPSKCFDYRENNLM